MRSRLSVRPLWVGSGRGGRRGDEPPSAVEVVEKAGDGARSEKDGRLACLSSAAAVGVEGSEDVVDIFTGRLAR